jgi:hypothetical protein
MFGRNILPILRSMPWRADSRVLVRDTQSTRIFQKSLNLQREKDHRIESKFASAANGITHPNPTRNHKSLSTSIPLSTPIPCAIHRTICTSFPSSRPVRSPHITVQGIGRQQHSYPSHSMHFVFPAAPLSLLTIELMVEEAAEPGPLRFTRVLDDVHILV